mmetsp:Transcript_13560/g.29015  ORF Transcript_13560/g.29015 Transcript_13560/m.29015 type:complete len:803 (-) Transcript_13560:816-3224(-)|eukprot:CAMPEP_0202893882 /NCGR_PEP_ID=MMETSP1392-20130828/3374_1 /ASSEMBLY_ACC=CAM_ASM_000868 /TAXON_ID=225041 /ORGANISM="Chlamydomonas chlamydogama, Strain SAG 11-48b" /LENGTH=802 /DNA_ID=CAMNT_0049578373 /DNA_START=66 /DNA_END=2474 /DNA_ORIENTATION=-
MSYSKRVVEEIKAATGASEEDVKAMLQEYNGDVNAATVALIETPFQKVDNHKKSKAVSSSVPSHSRRDQDGGHRGDRGPSGRREGGYGGGSGRGGRGGRGEGRGSGRGSGYGGRGSGRGFGGPSAKDNAESALAPTDNGHTAADAAGYSGVDSSASYADAGSSAAPNSSSWGPSASSASAAPPAAGAWGAGKKTMAEIIKARQVPAPAPVQEKPAPAPSPPSPAPAPAVSAPPASPPAESSANFVSTLQSAPAELPQAPAAKPAEPATAPVYQPTAWNSDASKTLLNLVGAKASSAQPSQTAPQPAPPPAAEQTLSAADNAVPVPTAGQYGAYGAAGAPPPEKPTTGAEVDALQLSFGNFGLGDFGANFGPSYGQQSDASLLPKQQAVPEPPAPAPQQEAYKPTNYGTYTLHGASEKITPAATTAPTAVPDQSQSRQGNFGNFGQAGSNAFGAGFGSNFASTAQDSAPQSYGAAQEAFANYGQDALKQSAVAYSAAAPTGYTIPPQAAAAYAQQTSAPAAAAAYNPSAAAAAAAKSVYAPYGQAQQMPAPAAPVDNTIASATNAGAPAASTAPSGVPTPPVPQMPHYGNPAAATTTSAMPPGMQYQNMYANPYQQFANPYHNMGYNQYGLYNQYQQSGYPPQGATSYVPPANNAYPHTGHVAQRSAHTYSPYPAAGAGASNQVAAGGYGASANPSSYLSGGVGYDDMSGAGAGAGAGGYGMGKEKDAGMYGGQQQGGYQNQGYNQRGGNMHSGYGGNYNMQGGYPNQGYNQPKGGYYNRNQNYNQQYGPPGHGQSNYKSGGL